MSLKIVNKIAEKDFAEELFDLIHKRRFIEKKEKELKDHFKTQMDDLCITVMMVGDYVLTLDERKTTSIDREKLADELGVIKAKEFEKEIKYKVLDLKKAA